MYATREVVKILALSLGLLLLSDAAQAGSIDVGTPSITDPVPGTDCTVTASVSVTGLPDGTYNVSITIYNDTQGGISTTTTGTVTITNGTGNVSISAAVPGTTSFANGRVFVEVESANGGETDVQDADWTYGSDG